MARGNWRPEVIIPKPRCRLCARIVNKADFVRLGGVQPAHRACAQSAGRDFTEGDEIALKPDAAIAAQ